MIASLRWPTIWYSTPTLLAFVWAQNVWLDPARPMLAAYLFWGALGVMLDVWATRRHRRAPPAADAKRFGRLSNWALVPVAMVWLGGLFTHPDPTPSDWLIDLDAMALPGVSALLPGLVGTRDLIADQGYPQVALHFSNFQVASVLVWVATWVGIVWLSTNRRWRSEFLLRPAAADGAPPQRPSRVGLRILLCAALTILACVFFWWIPETWSGTPRRYTVVADARVYFLAPGSLYLAHLVGWFGMNSLCGALVADATMPPTQPTDQRHQKP
ncbi:MAG: hypothetical protein FJX02_12930 [Alphaproteobacteria bacterium]|nr:hypothetical protein [Alphaproteobacteria bacterium]